MVGQLDDVGHVGVHVVAGGRLRRAAVPAPVGRNHAVALIEEEHELAIPVVARERPPVMKHQRLARAPVLVVNFGAVFYREFIHDFAY